MRYLLSGSLMRQVCPTALTEAVCWLEGIRQPVEPLPALHHAVVLRQRVGIR